MIIDAAEWLLNRCVIEYYDSEVKKNKGEDEVDSPSLQGMIAQYLNCHVYM